MSKVKLDYWPEKKCGKKERKYCDGCGTLMAVTYNKGSIRVKCPACGGRKVFHGD